MSQKQSELVVNLNNTIRLCGRTLKFDLSKKLGSGGKVDIYGKHGLGKVTVGVGSFTHPEEILETILHELFEGIMVHDEVAYDSSRRKRIFVFDHDYLDTFCAKLIDALVSCGAYTLPDEFTQIQGGGKG